jgi:hypothetical protein
MTLAWMVGWRELLLMAPELNWPLRIIAAAVLALTICLWILLILQIFGPSDRNENWRSIGFYRLGFIFFINLAALSANDLAVYFGD